MKLIFTKQFQNHRVFIYILLYILLLYIYIYIYIILTVKKAEFELCINYITYSKLL